MAHPHVFIDAKADLVFDEKGEMVAVRHVWRFDEAYSAFASQGLDGNGDGELSVEELKPLADINIESMKDYDYFTFMTAGDKEIVFAKPTEYWLQSDGGLLTLYFTLPTSSPVEVRSLPARVDVFDPTYFVAFGFVDNEPVTLESAPQGCNFDVIKPKDLDPSLAAEMAAIGPDMREMPPELAVIAQDLTNGVALSCP